MSHVRWIPGAAAAILALLALAGRAESADPERPLPPERSAYAALLPAYRPPAPAEHPADNALTPERRALGKLLFFDPRISGNGRIACATCHVPSHGWSEPRPLAVGAAGHALPRRTQTVLNTAWASALFWDGRAETLEQQALGPIEAPGEMNMPIGRLEATVNAIPGYRALFRRAYGADSITAGTVARAIAQFERTVVSGPAPFDRWVAGDERAVSAEAKRGFVLFNGKARCAQCHAGWRFTDDSFHDIGVPVRDAARADSGRGALVPGVEALAFAFKTPTLRQVAERAPYLHDGSAATLAAVIDLYDRGGDARRPSLSPEIRPLGLTAAEKRALVAFLRTLSSRDTVVAPTHFPR